MELSFIGELERLGVRCLREISFQALRTNSEGEEKDEVVQKEDSKGVFSVSVFYSLLEID